MKKATVVLVSTLLVGLSVGAARAEICYRLDPFGDVLRLSQITNGAHILVFGKLFYPGLYTLPVVGALELNSGSTSTRRLGIHGTNNTTFFAGNSNCVLDGTPGGSFFANCEGATSDPPFMNSGGPLTPVSCAGLPEFSPANAGPPLGGSGQ
jgi:hypothetical protein